MDNSLMKLKAALQVFSQMDHKMQVGTVLTFLEIADAEERKQNISVQDIEKRVGLQSGPASRNVYYWAEGHKEMSSGGHKFVTVAMNPDDRRRRDLKLTPKGKAVINRIEELYNHDKEARK